MSTEVVTQLTGWRCHTMLSKITQIQCLEMSNQDVKLQLLATSK